MRHNLRHRLPALAVLLGALFGPAGAAAQDFPIGSVTATISDVGGPCVNIRDTGDDDVIGATADFSDGGLKITLPDNGPLTDLATLEIVSILPNTASQVPATLKTDSASDDLSGTVSALLTLENEVPVRFSVEGTLMEGMCTAKFSAKGLVNPQSSNEFKPSSDVVRNQVVLSRTTQGVFVDSTRAVSQGLRALTGLRAPEGLALSPGNLGFSTRGLAAGGETLPLAVWGNAAYSVSENDRANTATESHRAHLTLGMDVAFNDRVLVGIAAGYEVDDTDTSFNAGNIETDGFTLVGYAGAVLTDALSADVAVGRSYLDSEQFRTAAGVRITSSLDSDRLFAAANLNYGHVVNQWLLTGRAGLLWAHDEQDAFVESDGTAVASSKFRVARLKIGGEVARSFGAFEPFASATYNYSFSQTDAAAGSPSIDRSDLLLGIGARYFASETLSGVLEVNTLLGRDDVEEHSVNLLLRANF